jgi:hypothetical protein
MNKIFFAAGIFLLFCANGISEARAQFIFTSCDRSTIEKYPKDENQPVIDYLDATKKRTDEFMKLFAESKFDKFYDLTSNRKPAIYVQRKSAFEGVPMSFTDFEKEYGKIKSYEYQHQRMTYILTNPIKLSEDVAYTIYVVKTEKPESEPIYLSLETSWTKASENPVIRNLYFKEGEKETSESKSSKCSSMPYGLMVESQTK